ncbi:glycosyltransferase [Francisellaceae bacterium]|nr:glycosyltransferase [Francisellaceae bacterium]
MHILILPSWYPVELTSIGGSFFREQAVAYKRTFPNDRVGVIYSIAYSILNIKPRISINKNDLGVKTLIASHVGIPKIRRLQIKYTVSKILELFRAYIEQYGKPEIIHVHSAWIAGLAALEIYNLYKIPYVLTEHNSSFASLKYSQFQLKCIKNVCTLASERIAVSERLADLLDSLFFQRFRYIPNSVSDHFFRTGENEVRSQRKFVFASISYLKKNKCIDVLIMAFYKAFGGNSSVVLKIGGDGPEMQPLIALTKKLNIDEQIIFLGPLLRRQVSELLKKEVNAFVTASRYETFGISLIEALAAGVPVISTKCGGPESIVNNKVGYLVEKENIEKLAKAMLSLYQSRKKWRAERLQIREFCKKNFSQETIATQYHKLYKDILNND